MIATAGFLVLVICRNISSNVFRHSAICYVVIVLNNGLTGLHLSDILMLRAWLANCLALYNFHGSTQVKIWTLRLSLWDPTYLTLISQMYCNVQCIVGPNCKILHVYHANAFSNIYPSSMIQPMSEVDDAPCTSSDGMSSVFPPQMDVLDNQSEVQLVTTQPIVEDDIFADDMLSLAHDC